MFPLDGLNAIVFRAKSTSTARNCWRWTPLRWP